MKKSLMFVIGFIAIISSIFLIIKGNRPEFFDIFGLIVFTFLFIIGFWMLKSKEKLPNWVGFTILLIGVLGLIVDGFIVIKTFILGG